MDAGARRVHAHLSLAVATLRRGTSGHVDRGAWRLADVRLAVATLRRGTSGYMDRGAWRLADVRLAFAAELWRSGWTDVGLAGRNGRAWTAGVRLSLAGLFGLDRTLQKTFGLGCVCRFSLMTLRIFFVRMRWIGLRRLGFIHDFCSSTSRLRPGHWAWNYCLRSREMCERLANRGSLPEKGLSHINPFSFCLQGYSGYSDASLTEVVTSRTKVFQINSMAASVTDVSFPPAWCS